MLTDLTPEMIAVGWLPHDGGPCPVPLDSMVTVMLRSVGRSQPTLASDFDWSHVAEHLAASDFDIIAYKLETPDE